MTLKDILTACGIASVGDNNTYANEIEVYVVHSIDGSVPTISLATFERDTDGIKSFRIVLEDD